MDILKSALRSLRAHPLFAALIVGLLALGIGANTAIFGVVHAVLLKPLPYPQPGDLVMVRKPPADPAANVPGGGDMMPDAEFLGFLPLKEVRTWLSRASVVVVPSVTAADGDSEGLPTVILEAQAACAPVLATRHAGNGEGVVENSTAILVDERDSEGLAAGIRFFISSPAAVASFGKAGRKFVGERFSLSSQVEGLERIYDRVRGLGP